ncbi:MAG: YafY family protein [Clostridia bacterium]|nr:YafY family protein [Clostridia bacterium]
MKFEIMTSILFELLSKRSVKANYLADKYEVSVRSVYRYIESLENAGVPIYTIRGVNGGFSIVDTYRLSSNFLTEHEYDKIISVLNAIASEVPDKIVNNIILKLKASAKKEFTDSLDFKAGNLIIDAGPWGNTANYKAKLCVLEQAIEDQKKLLITYHDRNGKTTERTIDPHVIVFKQGLWYVYAYCNLRKTFRFFKTGRIEKATILNEHFERQDIKRSDLPLDFWHNTVETEEISLEIDKSVLSEVEEWLGIENVEKVKGKFFATVDLPYDDGLVMKILSFGEGVKVLSPDKLIKRILNVADGIKNAYDK